MQRPDIAFGVQRVTSARLGVHRITIIIQLAAYYNTLSTSLAGMFMHACMAHMGADI